MDLNSKKMVFFFKIRMQALLLKQEILRGETSYN